jgi:hypothetical protein
MPQPAHVSSTDALDAFRSSLIVFAEKAMAAVSDVLDDVARTRHWLQYDQRTHWEAETRRRAKALENARQELFSARIGNLREAPTDKVMAVTRAQRTLDEALAILHRLKQWNRQYDQEVGPHAKEVEKLRTFLATDLKQSIALLTETLRALAAYAETRPPAPAAAAAAASSTATGAPPA